MRNLRTSLNPWLGTAGLFFVAVTLFGITYPAVDAWHDQWRDFAHQTTLGGHCSDAANVPNPECDSSDNRFAIEPWMIVPWLLSAGALIGSLAITSPFVRRRTDT